VVEQNLVVEISESTVGPFSNIQAKPSKSNRVREIAILRQLVEMQNQVSKRTQKQLDGR